MTKMSREKFKYLQKEKSFYDEIKSIFHHFYGAFIEANKKKCFWKVRVRLQNLSKSIIFTCSLNRASTNRSNWPDARNKLALKRLRI